MENKKDGQGLDNGPFYHGTKADLKIGDLLNAGFKSNYLVCCMVHVAMFSAIDCGGEAHLLHKLQIRLTSAHKFQPW